MKLSLFLFPILFLSTSAFADDSGKPRKECGPECVSGIDPRFINPGKTPGINPGKAPGINPRIINPGKTPGINPRIINPGKTPGIDTKFNCDPQTQRGCGGGDGNGGTGSGPDCANVGPNEPC